MTFTAVGTIFGQQNSSTFTFAPAGLSSAGHFALVEVIQAAAGITANSIASSNATWTPVTASFAGTTNVGSARIFLAQITSTSSATATVTYSGAASGEDIEGQEFSSTAGFSAVTFDVQGHIDQASGTTWASLTPGHGAGELYFGFAFDSGTASGGTTSGFIYQVPTSGNGLAYNVNCANSATAPVWGDSGQIFGLMVLMYEAAAAGGIAPLPQPGSPVWQRRYRPVQTPFPPTASLPPAPQPQLPPQPGSPVWQRRYRPVQVPQWQPLTAVVSGVAVPAPQQVPPVPRRRPARAVWAGGQGVAYVAVPAPRRLPPVPRRVPSRAVVRGSAPFLGYVAVGAPPQLPPIARRKPARAVVRGSAPFLGYVAVGAPIQQPKPAPRRVPARALWRGGQGVAYVAVPAPPQLITIPRRKPGRAVVEFTPVTTANAVTAVAPPTEPWPTVPVPRRRPARAVVQFTPVTTVNGKAAVIVGQPWPTVPVPRRRPARGLWHGGAGQAYVFVPAPRQQPSTIPRRQPSRATWRGGSGVAYVAVPAPRQQPSPSPRRRLARAYVQFKPVRTTNGTAVVVAGKQITADYDGKTWWKKKWILRL